MAVIYIDSLSSLCGETQPRVEFPARQSRLRWRRTKLAGRMEARLPEERSVRAQL